MIISPNTNSTVVRRLPEDTLYYLIPRFEFTTEMIKSGVISRLRDRQAIRNPYEYVRLMDVFSSRELKIGRSTLYVLRFRKYLFNETNFSLAPGANNTYNINLDELKLGDGIDFIGIFYNQLYRDDCNYYFRECRFDEVDTLLMREGGI